MSSTGDPKRDFLGALKRICDYDGGRDAREQPESAKWLECISCGGGWWAGCVESCRNCGTHLYVRDGDDIKKIPARTRPVGMCEEDWRHDCEVRYWANSGIVGRALHDLLIKKRRLASVEKVVKGVDVYLSGL